MKLGWLAKQSKQSSLKIKEKWCCWVFAEELRTQLRSECSEFENVWRSYSPICSRTFKLFFFQLLTLGVPTADHVPPPVPIIVFCHTIHFTSLAWILSNISTLPPCPNHGNLASLQNRSTSTILLLYSSWLSSYLIRERIWFFFLIQPSQLGVGLALGVCWLMTHDSCWQVTYQNQDARKLSGHDWPWPNIISAASMPSLRSGKPLYA